MRTWIFLRGLTRESRHWGAFPEIFQREFADARVIATDLPGNGRLNALASPCRVEAMVENVRAQLAGQGLAPPYHLLTMSLGAMVAVAWVTRHPGEIVGCVLINTSMRPVSPFYHRLKPRNYSCLLHRVLLGFDDVAREKVILELTSNLVQHRAEVLERWVAYRSECPVSCLNVLRQLLAAARYVGPSSRPASPILILGSEHDALVDPACSQQIAAQWNVPLGLHPSAGHDLPLDDGVWVTRQVAQWLLSESCSTKP